MSKRETSTRITIALFLSAFTLYAAGAVRTIFVGDSGELVAAVHILGIPHPSGYPLYVLLGKLWTLILPIGSVAFRMSLFSAAAAAASVAIVYRIGRSLDLARPAAAFGAMLLAVAPSFWGEANIQRVYSLNALFVALVTLFAVHWFRDGRDRDLMIAFCLAGLGATNHTFMAIPAIALAIVAPIARPEVLRRWRAIANAALAFAVGLLPYLFLPLRSRQDPRLDWGNPETWDAFTAVVTRREYWDRRWIEGPADLWPIALDFLRSLVIEGAFVGAPLALVAITASWRLAVGGWRWNAGRVPRQLPTANRQLLPLFALAVMAGNLLAMALHGSKSDLFYWHRYYIPSYVMLAILAAIGLDRLLPLAPRAIRLVPLAIPVVMLIAQYRTFDRSRFRIAEDYSRTLLRSVSPGARLIASDDNILFVLIYLQLVEGLRPDIDLILQGVAEGTPSRMAFNPDFDPIFFTHHPNWNLPQLEMVPAGLVYRAIRAGRPWPPSRIEKLTLEGEDDPRVPKDMLTENLIGEFHFMLGVTFENADWPRAEQQFARAAAAAPLSDALHYNLGLLYGRNGLYARAAEAFQRADAISPRGMASPSERAAKARGETLARSSAGGAARERQRLARTEQQLAARDPFIGSLAPSTAAWHRRMATLLDSESEPLAALGHRRLAAEIDSR